MGVPVHPLRRLCLWRAVHHRVQAVVERPHLAHLPERAALDVLHEAAHALLAVAVVANLRHHAVPLRYGVHDVHLRHREGHRLLHVDVQALRHGEDRSRGVVVVGRGDRHGVQLARHLLEHLAVVVERADLRHVRLRLVRLHHGAHLLPAARVRLRDADDLLLAHAVEDAVARTQAHAPAAPDEAQPDLAPGGDRSRERGIADIEQRQRRSAGRQPNKCPSLHDAGIIYPLASAVNRHVRTCRTSRTRVRRPCAGRRT